VLRLLERGDVITHIYSPKIGGVIKPDGSILREFREAIDRGVILDVAHGGTNFGLEIARLGIANGIIPHTISTDAAAVGILRFAEKGMAKIVRSDKTNACATDIQDPAFGLVTMARRSKPRTLTWGRVCGASRRGWRGMGGGEEQLP
jgi:predicted amidohydrolase